MYARTAEGKKLRGASCIQLPTDGEEIPRDAPPASSDAALGELQKAMRIGRNGVAVTVLLRGAPSISRFYDSAFIEGGAMDTFEVTADVPHELSYWGGPCSKGVDGLR